MSPAQTPRLAKKRTEILDAAAQVFAEEGFDAASMDRIADRAGASKRTVYNHFESKEALLTEVARRLFAQVQLMKAVAWDPDRDLAEQLAVFAEVKAFVAADPVWSQLMRVLLGVFIGHPDLAEKIMAQVAQEEEHLVHWLRAAHDAGALNVPDPARAAQLFWALASGLLFWPQVLGGPLSPKSKDESVDDVVQTFLARYRAAP